jgi:hypothetical protein
MKKLMFLTDGELEDFRAQDRLVGPLSNVPLDLVKRIVEGFNNGRKPTLRDESIPVDYIRDLNGDVMAYAVTHGLDRSGNRVKLFQTYRVRNYE